MAVDGWRYRKSHSLSGSTTDYQIQITVRYGAGTSSGSTVYLDSKCATDFSDIRFTNSSGTELSYWRESYTSSDVAIFWVKIPTISSDTTIYLYYGKSGASTTSDGDATFILFDHFDGSTLDSEKWTSGGSVVIDGSYCKLDASGDYIRSISVFGCDTAIRTSMIHYAANQSAMGYCIGTTSGFTYPFIAFNYQATRSFAYSAVSGTLQSITTLSAPSGTTKIFDIYREGNNVTKFYDSGSLVATHNTAANIPTGDINVRIGLLGAVTYNTDWILVRKLSASPPTQGSWGSEEEIPTATRSFRSDYSIEIDLQSEFDSIYDIEFVLATATFESIYDIGAIYTAEFVSPYDIEIIGVVFESPYSILIFTLFETYVSGGPSMYKEFRSRIESVTGIVAQFEEIL